MIFFEESLKNSSTQRTRRDNKEQNENAPKGIEKSFKPSKSKFTLITLQFCNIFECYCSSFLFLSSAMAFLYVILCLKTNAYFVRENISIFTCRNPNRRPVVSYISWCWWKFGQDHQSIRQTHRKGLSSISCFYFFLNPHGSNREQEFDP